MAIYENVSRKPVDADEGVIARGEQLNIDPTTSNNAAWIASGALVLISDIAPPDPTAKDAQVFAVVPFDHADDVVLDITANPVTLDGVPIDSAAADLLTHEAATMTVHGIPDTSLLVATVGGKIPTSVLPALPTGQFFPVASQAAMLALSTALPGATAVRTDLTPPKEFLLLATPPATLGNWIEVGGSDVASVNGQTGIVELGPTDVGAAAQGALDAETARAEDAEALLAPRASPAFSGAPLAPTATPGDSSTRIATTEFVQGAAGAALIAPWAATTAYAANQPMTHGGFLYTRITAGTSRGTFDSTEAALWTQLAGAAEAHVVTVGDLGSASTLNLSAHSNVVFATTATQNCTLAPYAGLTPGAEWTTALLASGGDWDITLPGGTVVHVPNGTLKTVVGYTPDGTTIRDYVVGVAFVSPDIATTKGDLLVATGAGVLVRKGAGTNGLFLKANSGSSDGLAWDTPPGGEASSWTSVLGDQTLAVGTLTMTINRLYLRRAIAPISGTVNLMHFGVGAVTPTGNVHACIYSIDLVTGALTRIWDSGSIAPSFASIAASSLGAPGIAVVAGQAYALGLISDTALVVARPGTLVGANFASLPAGYLDSATAPKIYSEHDIGAFSTPSSLVNTDLTVVTSAPWLIANITP